MREGKKRDWEAEIAVAIDRHWRWIVLLVWLGFCAWMVFNRWNQIRWLALGDTDDNMRIMQVRALLHGQGWYDLRNYRMNPPFGANIHWSRLVDLPIAGLILALRPLLGGPAAERWAVGIAPLLPYLLLLFSLALTARRLIDRRACPVAFLALCFAGSTNGMFMPERIDHHGWQLALLALCVAGIADPKRVRGGLTLGIATALSLAVGLEMIIYLAVAGSAMVLFWVHDPDERERLRAYAVSLVGGTALCFLIFASNDNRSAVCDALSRVCLSDAMLGGALLYGMAWLSPQRWQRRMLMAMYAGAFIAIYHAFMWPHCIQRLEGVSPEVERLWLSHVREARPIYKHGWRIAMLVVALPISGAIGWALLAWLRRADRDLLRRILGAAAPSFAASLLLLWQTRNGPAAQMLACVGAAAFAWTLVPLVWNTKYSAVRIVGTMAAVVIGLGAGLPPVLALI